jgi:hypothetical protein
LSAIERFLARIKELQTAVAERVVAAQARRRSWRVELLQDRIDKAIALSQARATMYASEMGESYQFQVADWRRGAASVTAGTAAWMTNVTPVFRPAALRLGAVDHTGWSSFQSAGEDVANHADYARIVVTGFKRP